MNIILAISMTAGNLPSICTKFETHIGGMLEFHLKTMI